MKEYCVYILKCSDSSYYTGITSDLEKRIWQHSSGWDPKAYTHNRRPLEHVYTAVFDDVYDAIAWEKRLKRWTRKKKEALIRREYERLPELAKKKNFKRK